MTLIIFVIFPLDIICILGLTFKKISYCITNLYSVSNPTVDVFSHFISPNLEEKNSEQDFSKHSFSLYCISLFFFSFLRQMSKVLQPYVSVLPTHSVPFTFTVHFLLSNVQAALLFLASEHIT